MTVLVIGVGNTWRSDDGVGITVAEEVAARSLPDVLVLAGISDPLQLLDLWVAADVTIIVDARVDRDGTPGQVRRHTNLSVIEAVTTTTSSHGLTIAQALSLGAELGRTPRQGIVYTIDAATVDPGTELTPCVAAAIPGVVAAVVADSVRAGDGRNQRPRATITGTRADCATAMLTEPNSLPVKPPRP